MSRGAAIVIGFVVATAAVPAFGADVLQTDERWLNVGASIGLGYAAVNGGEDDGLDLLTAQVGVHSILWSHWEAGLDFRMDFDPAAADAPQRIHSYMILLSVLAHLDMLPLTPFAGLDGGILLDGEDPALVSGTIGGCLGIALWFEATWRLTLRGTQRMVFGQDEAVPSMFAPTEVLLTGEWFF
jgi:hypothetical protein